MIYTFSTNFDAVAFAGTPNTVHEVGRGNSLRITKPRAADSDGRLLYDAWSAWPADDSMAGGGPPVPGRTWDNRFDVYGSNGGEPILLWRGQDEGLDPDLYLTEDDAWDAVDALLPLNFTGWDTYYVQTSFDDNPGDNRGGISLLVQIVNAEPGLDILIHHPDEPVKEEWQWQTDNQVAYDGSEDRVPLKAYPQRVFGGNYTFTRIQDIRQYQATIQKKGGQALRLPLFQYLVKLKAPITAGGSVVMCNAQRGDFRIGAEALLMEGDAWELVAILNVAADRVILQSTTEGAFSARAILVPVTKVYSPSGIGLTRVNPDHTGSAGFTFYERVPSLPVVPPLNDATVAAFDGMPVLDMRGIGGSFDHTFDTGIAITDYVAFADFFTAWTQSQQNTNLRYLCNRVWELDTWLWWQVFAATVQGSDTAFLLPTNRSDLPIVIPAAAEDNHVTVEGTLYSDTYSSLDTFKRIVINSDAGRHYAKVTAVVQVAGNDRLTFSPALPDEAGWDENQTVEFMLKVRIADDKVAVDHYGLRAEVSLAMRTVT